MTMRIFRLDVSVQQQQQQQNGEKGFLKKTFIQDEVRRLSSFSQI